MQRDHFTIAPELYIRAAGLNTLVRDEALFSIRHYFTKEIKNRPGKYAWEVTRC